MVYFFDFVIGEAEFATRAAASFLPILYTVASDRVMPSVRCAFHASGSAGGVKLAKLAVRWRRKKGCAYHLPLQGRPYVPLFQGRNTGSNPVGDANHSFGVREAS